MEQFSLEEYLENPNRKVVTRHGRPVRIVCWNRKHDFPIIALEDCGNGEFVNFVTSDGRIDLSGLEDNHDLFFADEEKCNKILNELKSYLKNTPKEQVEKDWQEIQDWYSQHFASENHKEEERLTEFEKAVQNILNEPHFQDTEAVKQFSKQLLDLARKEIRKEQEEEPKCIYNKTLDERKKFCKYCSAACVARIEEEPVSEDLEEAAKRYATEGDEISGLYTIDEEVEAFKAGAEWQKQQDYKMYAHVPLKDIHDAWQELKKNKPDIENHPAVCFQKGADWQLNKLP